MKYLNNMREAWLAFMLLLETQSKVYFIKGLLAFGTYCLFESNIAVGLKTYLQILRLGDREGDQDFYLFLY